MLCCAAEIDAGADKSLVELVLLFLVVRILMKILKLIIAVSILSFTIACGSSEGNDGRTLKELNEVEIDALFDPIDNYDMRKAGVYLCFSEIKSSANLLIVKRAWRIAKSR